MKPNIFLTIKDFIKRHGMILLSGVFCIVIDQILKQIARGSDEPQYLIPQIIGWEYFENLGIAFGIPLPQIIVIPLSVLIICVGVYYLSKATYTRYKVIGAMCVIAGALSNLIDRFIYGFTIDYIRIVTSILNLADILIIVGALMLLKRSKE
ncbi:MAG TPA: signal peptidase II [Candidatus Magasanikbacteria bacterium]|nr:signal peptidase II [Candidatus Magasanikbacteria bacterium]